MRNARFDDSGNVITIGSPGQLKVSMVFSDENDDATGETAWFNKRERFRIELFVRPLCTDSQHSPCLDPPKVLNFGFRTREDGTIECHHFGELTQTCGTCVLRTFYI